MMSNVSHARSDIAGHPDVSEMRARYERMLGSRDMALMDGPVFLVGLYCAVSPWVLHFTASQPALVTHNLVMGIALAVLALGFTTMPARMYGLSWAICAMGAWIILSAWIVGDSPDTGVVLNNVIVGGLTLLMGMVCMDTAARSRKKA